MDHLNHEPTATSEVPDRINHAIELLVQARLYAEQTSGDCWEFAVEIAQLMAMGLNLNDFRWLVRSGIVEHKKEVTLESDDGRAFRPTGDLVFPEGTCFVLTEKGASHANGSHGDLSLCTSNSNGCLSAPHWDAESRELSVNGYMVKRFRWQASNQERVLNAFEEEGWPRRIDDPLPPHPDQDSKRRLSDTIKCLNRKQANSRIRFRGDGTGEGIVWE